MAAPAAPVDTLLTAPERNSNGSNNEDGKDKNEGNDAGVDLDEAAYGIKYTFTLHDSEEGAAVDAPERVVPLGSTLQALAAAHGLRLAAVQNFQDIAGEMMLNDGKLRR